MVRNPEQSSPGAPQERRSSDLEQERTEKQQVRMFLFQSKRPIDLPDALPQEKSLEKQEDTYEQKRREQIGELQFTQMYFARRKSKDGEPDRLVPFGGDVDPDAKPIHAGLEQVTAQTHVRPTRQTITHAGWQTFSYQGKTYVVVNYTARLMPRDLGYALDPERNKIEAYVGVTLPEWQQLCDAGEIIDEDGNTLALSYHLNKDMETRAYHEISGQTDEAVQQTQKEITAHLKLTEADKKLKVLRALVSQQSPIGTSIFPQERKARLAQIDALLDGDKGILTYKKHLHKMLNMRQKEDNYDLTYTELAGNWFRKVNELWWAIAPEYAMESVRSALQATNLEAELLYASEKRFDEMSGKGLPTIDLIFPLLVNSDKELSFTEKKLLMSNPRTKSLMQITRMMHRFRNDEQSPAEQKQAILEALLKELDVSHHEKSFSVVSLSNEIDQYFDDLLEEYRDKDDPGHLRVENDVRVQEGETNAEHLMRLINFATNKKSEDENEQIIQWEAQRKLVLMMMLHELHGMREDVLEKGTDKLDAIEKSFLIPTEFEGRTDTHLLHFGQKQFVCTIKKRTKTARDMLRKMIVRNEGIGRDLHAFETAADVYGEAYIFESPDEEFEAYIPLDETIILANEQAKESLKEMYIPKNIAEWFQELKKHDSHLSIEEFKPLPKKGQPFVSAGAGGGDVIRMIKCDFVYRDDDGVETERKEVQIFVPSKDEQGEWHSGMEDFIDKKNKDNQYALKRLFNTRTLRSFMELMFPQEVYKTAAQKLYTDRLH